MQIGLSPSSAPLGWAIRESFRKIDYPELSGAQDLVRFWNERPDDGLVLGRDIPSRKVARQLSHLIIWEPVAGGDDFRVFLMGESLRFRFGSYATGCLMSDLTPPSVLSVFFECDRRLLTEDRCDCFDVTTFQDSAIDGNRHLNFELVAFPVWSHGRRHRWILNGAFYF